MHASTILITGGSGYIGSATATYLVGQGNRIVVIDKKDPQSMYLRKAKILTTCEEIYQHQFGPKRDILHICHAIEALEDQIVFIRSDFADQHILDAIFNHYDIDAVIHFAGFIEVGISVKDPAIFYENNVVKSLTLFRSMIAHNVKHIVFSSSAAVYGMANLSIIPETTNKSPINPYGKTKYMVEQILEDFDTAYGLKSICLRYFNAAGALPEYDIFERHEPETHVIPRLLHAIKSGSPFSVFGTDYQTTDGSCIRDYLHIDDLARAHAKALDYVLKNNRSNVFNLGTGQGLTIRQLIEAAQEVTGKRVHIVFDARRPGDPDSLVADARKAFTELNWMPARSDIREILRDAWSAQSEPI